MAQWDPSHLTLQFWSNPQFSFPVASAAEHGGGGLALPITVSFLLAPKRSCMPTLWLTADFSSWYISLWKNSQQMSETLSHLLLLLLLHNSVQNRAVCQPHN